MWDVNELEFSVVRDDAGFDLNYVDKHFLCLFPQKELQFTSGSTLERKILRQNYGYCLTKGYDFLCKLRNSVDKWT